MSAAEKLRALEELLPLYSNQSQPALWKVRHALPQIVALVEAAEHSLQWAQDELRYGPPELGLIVGELTPALAALDDALGAVT